MPLHDLSLLSKPLLFSSSFLISSSFSYDIYIYVSKKPSCQGSHPNITTTARDEEDIEMLFNPLLSSW